MNSSLQTDFTPPSGGQSNLAFTHFKNTNTVPYILSYVKFLWKKQLLLLKSQSLISWPGESLRPCFLGLHYSSFFCLRDSQVSELVGKL